ncbi:hypothetical protein QO001_004242 [Methylobacterium brachiatum]|uniref:Uncharacterized protein n=1 Tax=Methylobacterium brachiatum TaxID=269660 RepID=A0AAJ1TV13_9HYPH|nr:hypothetical protein [Methylobacterium brachiatum]
MMDCEIKLIYLSFFKMLSRFASAFFYSDFGYEGIFAPKQICNKVLLAL